MNDKEAIIRHLEMIQKIINRLGRNSFLIKGWSTVMPSVIILFLLRNDMSNEYILPLLFVPIVFIPIGFGVLDAYYLWQEKLFRGLYDEVRKQDKTDFGMQPSSEVGLKNKWFKTCWSRTIRIFYGTQIGLISLIIGFILLIYFF